MIVCVIRMLPSSFHFLLNASVICLFLPLKPL